VIPRIPPMPAPTAPQPDLEPEQDEFTVRDGAAWLGLPWSVFEEAAQVLSGRHGGPFVSALLDARDAQGTSTTADEILARHGIDPADPLDAAHRFDRDRARYDN
jgi:hypothetical protein